MINQVIEVCSTDLLKGDWSEKEFKQYLEYDGRSIDSQINDLITLGDYFIQECIKTHTTLHFLLMIGKKNDLEGRGWHE